MSLKDKAKTKFTIETVLVGKSIQQRELILKDKMTTQIFVCLYRCGGNCENDVTCPWLEGKDGEQK